MSSNSSIATFPVTRPRCGPPAERGAGVHPACLSRESLHLVEHGRERSLQFEGLFDFSGAHKRIFGIFEEARALMIADKLYECGGICLPVHRETLEILEHRPQAGDAE